jgi:glutamine amidotransferase
MIVIVDSGMGNVGSIANMIKRSGHRAELSANAEVIGKASRLILPGVGAFDAGVQALRSHELWDVLDRRVREGVPVLGICLGMHLLTKGSDEGVEKGFGWISGRAVRISPEAEKKIPHMGWSEIKRLRPSPLFDETDPSPRFYFVHSFHVVCDREEDRVATVHYGEEMTAVLHRDHVFGTQFHPEKSHRFGVAVFKRFLEFKV